MTELKKSIMDTMEHIAEREKNPIPEELPPMESLVLREVVPGERVEMPADAPTIESKKTNRYHSRGWDFRWVLGLADLIGERIDVCGWETEKYLELIGAKFIHSDNSFDYKGFEEEVEHCLSYPRLVARLQILDELHEETGIPKELISAGMDKWRDVHFLEYKDKLIEEYC